VTDNPCNCGNCSCYDTRDHVVLGEWVTVPTCNGKLIPDMTPIVTKQCGCLIHPEAQKFLMGEILNEMRKDRDKNILIVRNVINIDKSGLAQAINAMQQVYRGYQWIPNGEWGSYDHTQRTVKTLQQEVGHLLGSLESISVGGLRESGNRVLAHIAEVETSLRKGKPYPIEDRCDCASDELVCAHPSAKYRHCSMMKGTKDCPKNQQVGGPQ
jgi:hypothetical protein